MTQVGHRRWVMPAGHMPLRATGHEPEFTSRAQLSILNAGPEAAAIVIRVYFEDREPLGPFRLRVEGRRARAVRFNDLIDPQALPLETPFAAVLESDVPVVVQFTRQDTSQAACALTGTMAFPHAP
jgi:hypothetical protein